MTQVWQNIPDIELWLRRAIIRPQYTTHTESFDPFLIIFRPCFGSVIWTFWIRKRCERLRLRNGYITHRNSAYNYTESYGPLWYRFNTVYGREIAVFTHDTMRKLVENDTRFARPGRSRLACENRSVIIVLIRKEWMTQVWQNIPDIELWLRRSIIRPQYTPHTESFDRFLIIFQSCFGCLIWTFWIKRRCRRLRFTERMYYAP